MFSPRPGRTNLIQHHIETEPGVVVRSRPYRLPEHKKKRLVPKTDGSVRFCVDYHKVNAVSKFDAYPMPRVDELLDRLGTARFYSTLDLTKGYWQIPLSPLSKEKSAFTTPFGLHQFVTLPFGLFGAPSTFQRLMDKILRPHTAYAAAYLDDIIIYSQDWQRHMVHLREVLRALRGAGLTANPKKCAIGRVEVRYLGFHLGHGQVTVEGFAQQFLAVQQQTEAIQHILPRRDAPSTAAPGARPQSARRRGRPPASSRAAPPQAESTHRPVRRASRRRAAPPASQPGPKSSRKSTKRP